VETQQQHDANDLAEQRFAELVGEAWEDVQRRHAKLMEEYFARIRAVVRDWAAGSWRDAVSEGTGVEVAVPMERSALRRVCKEWETGHS
jgi:hypothetical protein